MKILHVINQKGWALDKIMDNIKSIGGMEIKKHYIQEDGVNLNLDGIDVVHMAYWGNLFVNKQNNKQILPLVVTIQHIEEETISEAVNRIKAAKPDMIISSCKLTQKLLKKRGIKSIEIPNTTPQKDFRVGYIALDQPLKKLDVIDKACDIIGAKNVGIKVNKIKSDKLLNEEQLEDYYRKLNVYVVASECEGGPMPPIEAMAYGTPVISTKVGIMPELKNVTYFDGTIENLTKKLKKFIPKTHLTIEECSRKHYEVYKQAIFNYGH